MPRSIWNGTITFGLIAVPIKVNSAIEDTSIHFHQVHASDGAQIKQKRICSKEHKEVPYKEVAKGYELRGGKYVLLSQDEIDAAAGRQSRLIELEEFVCGDEIDPVYYDRAYYLGPALTGPTPTACCTMRSSASVAWGSGAGFFTTASSWSRFGPSGVSPALGRTYWR
jgi:Ku protein